MGRGTRAVSPVEPLPPRSTPNETDSEILSLIEAQWPVQTGVIAEQVDCSKHDVHSLLQQAKAALEALEATL